MRHMSDYNQKPWRTTPTSRTTSEIEPCIIIHGGAGNITPEKLGIDGYRKYKAALVEIVREASQYMRTPVQPEEDEDLKQSNPRYPSALDVATFAVTLLENNPLFNSGHGAVFTRDGINEMDSSVMVSRGHAKRGVGLTGMRRVKNPILLAKAMLEHGDEDLGNMARRTESSSDDWDKTNLDIPSAQGHTLLYGPTAEQLAEKYGLELVDPEYFFTQKRWDEHIQGLEKEKAGNGPATWSADDYFPQGTCGAVAMDRAGVMCVATSTGGMTNKLTGRVGDTPVVGAGFWAEEWDDPSSANREPVLRAWRRSRTFLKNLESLFVNCFMPQSMNVVRRSTRITRSIAVSGTGNGDSFLRVAAARTVGSIARWGGLTGPDALCRVAGDDGELQASAGDRWGKTGEGEGGMIGLENVVLRDKSGRVISSHVEILQDLNCAGMFRAWDDGSGSIHVKVFHPKTKEIRFHKMGMNPNDELWEEYWVWGVDRDHMKKTG
ncbi:N-terminal nucleophile aminohydrolase [Rostrohypoxylon terebratum]|nr:N-terminal nucleophile aminohydrolase [Rostrohypoxylon terebratum]